LSNTDIKKFKEFGYHILGYTNPIDIGYKTFSDNKKVSNVLFVDSNKQQEDAFTSAVNAVSAIITEEGMAGGLQGRSAG